MNGNKISIADAKKQLALAIKENQQMIAGKICEAREQLEIILIDLIVDDIAPDLKEEIFKLSNLIGDSRPSTNRKGSSNIKTRDKVTFILSELEKSRGMVTKKELLELAAVYFGKKPAATFLDAALADEQFSTKKEGRKLEVTRTQKEGEAMAN